MTQGGWLSRLGPVFLLLGLLVVCYPRFNRDTGGDGKHYVDLVRYFRSQIDSSALSAPFSYRVAGPLLASLLPLDPMTALNIVNLLALGVTTLLIQRIILMLSGSLESALAGSGLFIFSFPTFYYGTIAYVDPVLICSLTLFVFALCVKNQRLAVVAFLFGCLAKESMLLTTPAYFAYALRSGGTHERQVVRVAIVVGSGVIVLSAIRWLIPVGSDLRLGPSLQFLVTNSSRPFAWLSVLLSFGIPGFLLTVLLCRRVAREKLFRHAMGLPLSFGALGSIILLAATWCAAHVDGRPVWTLYPFAVPMIALMSSRSTSTERRLTTS